MSNTSLIDKIKSVIDEKCISKPIVVVDVNQLENTTLQEVQKELKLIILRGEYQFEIEESKLIPFNTLIKIDNGIYITR